jgi:hypothetical protein
MYSIEMISNLSLSLIVDALECAKTATDLISTEKTFLLTAGGALEFLFGELETT